MNHAQASGSPAQSPSPAPPAPIFGRFFLAAIAIGLSAGAIWGIILLLGIGRSGSFTGVSIYPINAHGLAQIYGWIGLFVMGFGYQAFPRMVGRPLHAPRWAGMSFGLMLIGLILGAGGTAMAGRLSAAAPAAIVGSGMIAAAMIIFATITTRTFSGAPIGRSPWAALIVFGATAYAGSAVFNVAFTAAMTLAPDRAALLGTISIFQAPLRNMQFHAGILPIALGVSMKILPPTLGVRPTPPRAGWAALWLIALAVSLEVGFFLAFRAAGDRSLAGGVMLGWIALTAAVVCVAWPWRLWRRPAEGGRVGKFVRAAYCWLAISLALQLLFPIHQALSGTGFSHAYYGAVRHAFTVGFLSLLIVGVSSKVVPTVRRIDPRSLPALWAPFVLINLGCLLRVSMQIGTDWRPEAFMIVPISGALELAGLGLWGGHIARLLLRRGGRESRGGVLTALRIQPRSGAGASEVAPHLPT